jgi:aminoglycoside phosphotransferase (APT) family kinase protein
MLKTEEVGGVDIPARLTEWFQQRNPAAESARVENFISPEIGYSSETLLFDLVRDIDGKKDNEALVVRLRPQGIPLFETYDLRKQYRIMDTLAGSDIPVPKMIAYEEDESILGSPFYVMSKVNGQIPADNPPYHMTGWFAEQSPEEVRATWFSGVEKLAKVGRLNYSDYDLEFLNEPELGETPILQHIQVYDELLEWGLDRSRQPLLESTLSWLRGNCPKDEPVALAWGDSRISNQIFQNAECVACIDWEMARLGNPIQDIAWWLVLDQCLSTYMGIPRNEFVPSEVETLAHWEKFSGRKLENLLYYKVFSAFCFSVIMARLNRNSKASGEIPEDDLGEYENLATTQLKALFKEMGITL